MSFNDFLNSINWNAVSGITAFLGMLITTILTFKIITQTSKLNKQQSELEKRLTQQQIDIQRKQIKADLFPYKRELYKDLYKVMEFCECLRDMFDATNPEQKTFEQLYMLYDSCLKQYHIDDPNIYGNLREAHYILPSSISPTVLQITKLYDHIGGDFTSFKIADSILLPEEKGRIKKQKLDSIKQSLDYIMSKAMFIESIMPIDLDITRLDE